MRKNILFSLVALVTLGLVALKLTPAFAASNSPDAAVGTYTLSATATATLASLPTGARLLGYTYAEGTAGGFVSLNDSAIAGTINSTTVFSDVISAANYTTTVVYPLPKTLTNGLVVKMSDSTGVITVYYE